MCDKNGEKWVCLLWGTLLQATAVFVSVCSVSQAADEHLSFSLWLLPVASVPKIAPAEQRSHSILHVNEMLISFFDHKSFCFDYCNKIYTFIATANIFTGHKS